MKLTIPVQLVLQFRMGGSLHSHPFFSLLTKNGSRLIMSLELVSRMFLIFSKPVTFERKVQGKGEVMKNIA
jgi:hypothetical protein